MHATFSVETRQAKQCLDITAQVQEIVDQTEVAEGLCHVMVLHSTAAVVVNETADPNIGEDVLTALDSAVPERAGWLHDRIDDNAHSHIKASLLGPSEVIPIREGQLVLGTWQGIMLFEFDGPRKRRIAIHVLPGST